MYSLACSIGVGVKFVFSIEGRLGEVAGLHCRSLVTGDSTSNTMVTFMTVTVILKVTKGLRSNSQQ